MTRRRLIASFGAMALFGILGLSAKPVARAAAIQRRLRELEAAARGRLGVTILDTATGQDYGYRPDERFMMLSSFKWLASALVLHRVDRGQESLDRRIAYAKKDLIAWIPVTQQHADGEGMTLAQLCEAAVTTSDNTAANLILSSCGGPAAVTVLARQLGDSVTRLDRNEPELNVKRADALLDTTSPRAMAHTLNQLVLGDALHPASRHRLQQWLLSNTTGGKRLKAGPPQDWRIGDKTGTNTSDANYTGVVWLPQQAPLLVTAYPAE